MYQKDRHTAALFFYICFADLFNKILIIQREAAAQRGGRMRLSYISNSLQNHYILFNLKTGAYFNDRFLYAH